jgi:hypothetical protein
MGVKSFFNRRQASERRKMGHGFWMTGGGFQRSLADPGKAEGEGKVQPGMHSNEHKCWERMIKSVALRKKAEIVKLQMGTKTHLAHLLYWDGREKPKG